MSNEYLNNKMFEAIINRFQTSKKNKLRHEILLEELVEKRARTIKRIPDFDDSLVLTAKFKSDTALMEFTASQKSLADAFYTLANNIVKYAKFNLIDEDDAIQEGVMICFEKLDRFNSNRGKAFNYFTTVQLNHFRQLFRTAKNYNELKRKYHEFSCLTLMSNGRHIG